MNAYANLLEDWDVPEWVFERAHWRSALFLLGAPVLAERNPWQFVNLSVKHINWLTLERVSASWTAEERLLVRIAHDLYNNQGGVAMGEILRMLGPDSFQHFVNSLRVWRGEHPMFDH